MLFAQFGPLNWHPEHALPQFDRPRALINFFSIGGIAGPGVSGNFMLPPLFFSAATSLNLEIFIGEDNYSFTSQGKYNLLGVGHLKYYYDLSRDAYFEWHLGGITGKNDPAERFNSYVGSLALIYKWAPVGREKYGTIDWKTEFLYSYREGLVKNIKSKGFYTSLKNKLNARFWLCGRIGYSELPYDNNQCERDYTVCLDFWQSEFVFVRFHYQYNQRNLFDPKNTLLKLSDDQSFVIKVCWEWYPINTKHIII